MTYFDYIKNVATVEQIAQIFDYLENDSGYYTKNNVSAISHVTDKPKIRDDEKDLYNDFAYYKAKNFLNSEIEEE